MGRPLCPQCRTWGGCCYGMGGHGSESQPPPAGSYKYGRLSETGPEVERFRFGSESERGGGRNKQECNKQPWRRGGGETEGLGVGGAQLCSAGQPSSSTDSVQSPAGNNRHFLPLGWGQRPPGAPSPNSSDPKARPSGPPPASLGGGGRGGWGLGVSSQTSRSPGPNCAMSCARPQLPCAKLWGLQGEGKRRQCHREGGEVGGGKCLRADPARHSQNDFPVGKAPLGRSASPGRRGGTERSPPTGSRTPKVQ